MWNRFLLSLKWSLLCCCHFQQVPLCRSYLGWGEKVLSPVWIQPSALLAPLLNCCFRHSRCTGVSTLQLEPRAQSRGPETVDSPTTGASGKWTSGPLLPAGFLSWWEQTPAGFWCPSALVCSVERKKRFSAADNRLQGFICWNRLRPSTIWWWRYASTFWMSEMYCDYQWRPIIKCNKSRGSLPSLMMIYLCSYCSSALR